MSPFEVRRFFTLQSEDRHPLRRRFRSRARLGAALQLGFLRMTGTTLDAFDYVPRPVLDYLSRQLGISVPELTTLRGLYRRQMTLFMHQRWACEHAGFRRHLDEAIPASARESWLPRLLREMSPGPMTVLEWVRRPPRKRSKKTLDEELSKLWVIRDFSPPQSIERIPVQRLRAYARRMRRRRPIRVREVAEPRRTLEIAALLTVLARRQSDTVLRLIEMRIAEVWSWAHAVARPAPRHTMPEEVAAALARAMDDPVLTDAQFRDQARALPERVNDFETPGVMRLASKWV